VSRVALVTGAARGIGRATVDRFLAEGWDVVGVDLQEPEAPFEGGKFRTLDIADPGAVEDLFATWDRRPGRLDVLVNNAAVQICKPLVEMTLEEWDRLMATNLRAVFLMVRAAYPWLKAARGAIVNVSSVHAVATSKEIAAYAASKGGLVALTRAMGIEFAEDGVRANAILPGAVDTDMLRDGLSRGHVAGASIDERLDDLGLRTVMGRVGRPEEIAEGILFLADSQRSGFMTGQTLIIDGGATARLSTE